MDNQYQWRVVFYEQGEEPPVEIMNSFADAWAVALPYPQEDGLKWQILKRADALATLEAHAVPLTVACASAQTYTTIERI